MPSAGRASHYYNELGLRALRRKDQRKCRPHAGICLRRLRHLPAGQGAETATSRRSTVYAKRSQNYRNLFDPQTGLMRGKNKDGSFQSPFNPFKWGDAFTEGNSWHYTWSVFHDVQGLVDLMGGRQKFVAKLDSVFTLPPVFDESYYGGVIHEIREMQIANMGQYAHGNQPIQHMIYLYNYAGEPWKTQYWLREVMNRLYLPTPDGYCGDEDNGQTSAWYVFSALGFYPVCPATDQYVLGAPLFKKVTATAGKRQTDRDQCRQQQRAEPLHQYGAAERETLR